LNAATVATTVTLDISPTVSALNFDSFYGYSLVVAGSGTLTLSSTSGPATIAITNVFGNGAHTIAVPLVLASPLIVTQNSSGPLTIAGPISDGGNGYSLTTTGSGLLCLTGPNTYNRRFACRSRDSFRHTMYMGGAGQLNLLCPKLRILVVDPRNRNPWSRHSQRPNPLVTASVSNGM